MAKEQDDIPADLPPDILKDRVKAAIRLEERKQALEEKRLDHQIALDNRIEDFKQAECMRLAKMADQSNSENWMKSYWRPAMGWIYALICLFDFVLAPIMTIVLPTIIKGVTYTPWKSLTLENGGMIHLAFAAILGVTAWTRGQENILKTKITSGNSNGS